MDLSILEHLDGARLRAALPEFLTSFVQDSDLVALIRSDLEEISSARDDHEASETLVGLRGLGDEPRLYTANPWCRDMSRVYSRHIFTDASKISGVSHLAEAVEAGPVVIVANHLAYLDSTAIDGLLARAGHLALADRIASIAGPKVYTDLFRRYAAACLNTLPTAQSRRYDTEISPREAARRALATMDAAREGIEGGFAILVYPEGSRTRTGRLGSFLRAVHRYACLVPNTRIVPAVLTGTEGVMPVGEQRIYVRPITLSFAPSILVPDRPAARAALARSWYDIAARLPEAYAPEVGTEPVA